MITTTTASNLIQSKLSDRDNSLLSDDEFIDVVVGIIECIGLETKDMKYSESGRSIEVTLGFASEPNHPDE